MSTETGVRLYNTITKSKVPLTVGPEGVVRIYVCGPTVYGRVHIGNARPFVVFSVLARFLRRNGLAVRFVSNLTDINDKIYDAARTEGTSSTELADRYGKAYIDDTNGLGLGRPDSEPKVTDTLPEIVDLIAQLVDRGLAYPSAGDVYFRVGSFPGYGSLSGRTLEDMVSGEGGVGKEHPLDFALWKAHKPTEDAFWPSPWGPGRPGWHIECSAMAEAILGRTFEIHGGGIDLIFPHHENEIAQTEGAHGVPLAQIWMHNGMLELAGDKMSKSVGNIALLSDVLGDWPKEVVLTYFLSSHYRSPLPFNDERLGDAKAQCERIANTLRSLRRAIDVPGEGVDAGLAAALSTARSDMFAALADDFATPEAFAAIFGLIRVVNTTLDGVRPGAGQLREVQSKLLELLDVFGLGQLDREEPQVPESVLALARARDEARTARDFARSDALRAEIEAQGFTVRDGASGSEVLPA